METVVLQLDDHDLTVLRRIAQRRKTTLHSVIQQAVDDFLERIGDEELLNSSAQVARRTGLREADAVGIVQEWRTRHQDKGIG